MLQDLHRAHHVVPFRLFEEFLGKRVAVCEFARRGRRGQLWVCAGMRGRNANVRFRGIDAQGSRTHPCQALDEYEVFSHARVDRRRAYFGEQSTATPDVEDVQSPENVPPLLHAASYLFSYFLARDLDEFFADVLYPGRVHAME